jgi:hypothetical protein
MGELSAIDWLASNGAPVYIPLGHSRDVDVVTDLGDGFVGVQVKTCRVKRGGRWEVTICTRGGNQSWSGIVKRFSRDRCDYLFVLVTDGRRWFIPSLEVEGGTHIALGGPKYARFEVEPGRPFAEQATVAALS